MSGHDHATAAPESVPPLTGMPPTAAETATVVPQRQLTTVAYGDNAAEIEAAALGDAREVFGEDAQLEVKRDYEVKREYSTTATGKYWAAVTVLAPQ